MRYLNRKENCFTPLRSKNIAIYKISDTVDRGLDRRESDISEKVAGYFKTKNSRMGNIKKAKKANFSGEFFTKVASRPIDKFNVKYSLSRVGIIYSKGPMEKSRYDIHNSRFPRGSSHAIKEFYTFTHRPVISRHIGSQCIEYLNNMEIEDISAEAGRIYNDALSKQKAKRRH